MAYQKGQTKQSRLVALRYLITNTSKSSNWVEALPAIQAGLNNATYAVTGLSPNEIMYGFKAREALSLIGSNKDGDHEMLTPVLLRLIPDASIGCVADD